MKEITQRAGNMSTDFALQGLNTLEYNNLGGLQRDIDRGQDSIQLIARYDDNVFRNLTLNALES